MGENDIWFDKDKVFKETGIYRVEGYDATIETLDGEYYDYNVEKITKLCDLEY